jgi:hypothetical protein
MANVSGVNYKAALVTVPAARVHQGEWGGKELVMMDTYVMTGDAADGDTINMGRLPAGAKVTSARIFGADLGGTGTLKLGHTASNDGSAADSAVDNAYITAADSSGQAWDVMDSASAAMRGAEIDLVRLNKECDLQIKFVGATSGATGVKITSIVKYVVC